MRGASLLMAVSIAMVVACMCSAGYAADFSATTVNTDNNLSSNYIELELNDSSGSAGCMFTFSDLVYMRDKTVTSNGVVTSYKSNTATSDRANLYIDSVGESPGTASTVVRLTSAVAGATIVFQLYSDYNCTTAVGNPITLTTSDQSLGDLTTDTDYYCKVTITLEWSVLDQAMDGVPGDGTGSVSFGLTFTSTAVSV